MDISRPADYLLHRADETQRRSKKLSTVAIVGFQFGLYRVVAPLSFLRSISLASLFATSGAGWQIGISSPEFSGCLTEEVERTLGSRLHDWLNRPFRAGNWGEFQILTDTTA